MRWSLRLGRIRTVPVEIHWLFLPLLAWLAFQEWDNHVRWMLPVFAYSNWLADPELLGDAARSLLDGLRGFLASAGMLILVFACVLVHEVGHMVHAQALGIPVRRILLLPFGGLAELARLPERPVDELRVALAGPAANLGLGLIFGGLAYTWTLAEASSVRETLRLIVSGRADWLSGALVYLAAANFGIALFNLVPAFPMDGGRLLRSLLALVLTRLTATRLVSGLSWAFSGLFILLGLGFGERWLIPASPGLALVGLFVVFGAGFEKFADESRAILQRIAVRAAVRQPTWTLSPTDLVTPGLISAFLLYPILPVVVGVKVVGLFSRQDLENALKSKIHFRGQTGHGPGYTVAHLMRTRFPYLRADEDLWRAQQLLLGADLGALPVLDGDRLYGMLTPADIHAARTRPADTRAVATSEEAPTFTPCGGGTS